MTLVVGAAGKVYLALAFFRNAHDALPTVHAVLHELIAVRSAHSFFQGRLFASVGNASTCPTAVMPIQNLESARHFACIARSDLNRAPLICDLPAHAQFIVFRYL